MRRTISNLSRELGVSRPRIYRALERLEIEKRSKGEYELDEWELLKKELTNTSNVNKQKKADAEKVALAEKSGAKKAEARISGQIKICDIDAATLRERLHHAKQEYDYNKSLIIKFQEETDEFFLKNGTTTMITHNGTLAAIPAVVNLDKYVKLNVTLSKLISELESELESELDLEADGEDDDFFV